MVTGGREVGRGKLGVLEERIHMVIFQIDKQQERTL